MHLSTIKRSQKMNNNSLVIISAFVATLLSSGCATNSNSSQVYAPNEQLDEVLFRYAKVAPIKPPCEQEQREVSVCNLKSTHVTERNNVCGIQRKTLKSCQQNVQLSQAPEPALVLNLNCHDRAKPVVDCYRLASELNGLHIKYPNSKRIMMAAALLEFELGNTASSQQLLDSLLSKRGAYPEAAILRSRIAMEEGNLTLARSVINKQLNITPDHPYLYEMQASYYYMEGKYTDALQSVKIAERFMKPNWRIAHHRGIIYEAQEQWYKACKEYKQILKEQPNNRVINAKIRLLDEHVDCYVNSNYPVFTQL